jgi:hypothetical protein
MKAICTNGCESEYDTSGTWPAPFCPECGCPIIKFDYSSEMMGVDLAGPGVDRTAAALIGMQGAVTMSVKFLSGAELALLRRKEKRTKIYLRRYRCRGERMRKHGKS